MPENLREAAGAGRDGMFSLRREHDQDEIYYRY
jgi:hypothetical protein